MPNNQGKNKKRTAHRATVVEKRELPSRVLIKKLKKSIRTTTRSSKSQPPVRATKVEKKKLIK